MTLVGNDTGGALCQLVVTRHPERIGRLVLTNCDAYENFPPRHVRVPVLRRAAFPGFVWALAQPMRIAAMRTLPIAFGWLSKQRHPGRDHRGLAAARARDARRAARHDEAAQGRGQSDTHEAATHFKEFDKPVLIAWAPEKDFFPVEYGERLARDFPKGRLERIEDCYTFVPEDQPERLAKLIAEFAREPARRRPR